MILASPEWISRNETQRLPSTELETGLRGVTPELPASPKPEVNRRRQTRVETEWPAVIQLGDTVLHGVVRNASTSGALLVLSDTTPRSFHAALQNETVLIAMQTEEQPDGIQLTARVRRAETCATHHALRVGLEFSGRRLSYADF